MEKIVLRGGLDAGNGYMKGLIGGRGETVVYCPSACAYYNVSRDIKAEGPRVAVEVDNIFNRMDLSFSSPLVPDGKRRIFGTRAIESPEATMTFDVNGEHVSKAEQEMSSVMVLGMFAGAALKEWYAAHGELPDGVVPVEISCVLALPISEYRDYRRRYSEGFLKSTHLVTFWNFAEPVRLELKFTGVTVMAEGATGQYAIRHGGVDIERSLSEAQRAAGLTARKIRDAKDVLVIDIGEGTVNFVVFREEPGVDDPVLSPDASDALTEGYGTVLGRCVGRRLRNIGMPFKDRKQLADYIRRGDRELAGDRYARIMAVVEDEAGTLVARIMRFTGQYIADFGAVLKAVVVMGGGSIPLRGVLERELSEYTARVSEIPVIYADESYAGTMNATGLRMAADALYGVEPEAERKK